MRQSYGLVNVMKMRLPNLTINEQNILAYRLACVPRYFRQKFGNTYERIPVPCGSHADVLMSWKSSCQFLVIYKCHIVVYGLPCVPRYFSQTFVAIYELIPGPYGSHTDVLIVMKMRPSVCQIYAWISIEFRIPCVPGYLGKTFSNNYERIHVPCGTHTDFSMWWKCAFQF